jgi:hypothetical protein
VAAWIENLHGLLREMERRINQEPWKYTRGSLSSLQPSRQEQVKSIRELCSQMLDLRGRVMKFLNAEPLTPIAEIENLLQLAQGSTHQTGIIDPRS